MTSKRPARCPCVIVLFPIFLPYLQHLLFRSRRSPSPVGNEILIKHGLRRDATQHRGGSSDAPREIRRVCTLRVHFRANVCHGFPTRCTGEWRHRRGYRPITTTVEISRWLARFAWRADRSSWKRTRRVAFNDGHSTMNRRRSRRLFSGLPMFA